MSIIKVALGIENMWRYLFKTKKCSVTVGILGYVVHKRVWLWFHSFSFDTIEENCYSVFYISNNPSYLKLL